MEITPKFLKKDDFRKPTENCRNYEKHTSLEDGFKTIFFQILGNK